MELDRFDTERELKQLLVLRDRINELSHELSGNAVLGDSQPRLDLFDLGDAYRVEIEVPGVPQDKLEVALRQRDLIVAGMRDTSDDGAQALLSERPRGRFQRTIALPGEVDREASHAHLKEGLLILHLPKKR
jgi:HSP20 family protein